MATVARLSVSVTANTKKFSSGLLRAKKTLKSFGRSITKIGKQVSTFGIGLGAAALAGVSILTKQAFTAIDSMAKLSDSIGISTEDIAGFQLAAEITGVSVQMMNDSLEKMVKRIGAVVGGTGAAKQTLSDLGLSAVDLANSGGAEAFGTIADAINKLGTDSERTNAAFAIFGKSGIKLTNTLALGSKGILAFKEEAKLMGLAVSRVDSAKIEAANDSMNRLGKISVGLARQFSVKLAPFIQLAADKMVAFSLSGGGATKKIIAGFGFVLKVMGRLADTFEVLKAGFFALKGTATIAILGIGLVVQVLAKEVDRLLSILSINSGLEQSVSNFNDGLVLEAEKSFAKAGEAFGNALDGKNSKAISKFVTEIQDAAELAGKSVEKNVEDKLSKVIPVVKKIDKALRSMAKGIVDSVKSPMEKFVEKMQDINKAFNAGLISVSQRSKAIDLLKGKFGPKSPAAAAAAKLGAREINPNLISTSFSNKTKDVQKVSDPENKLTNKKMDEVIALLGIPASLSFIG